MEGDNNQIIKYGGLKIYVYCGEKINQGRKYGEDESSGFQNRLHNFWGPVQNKKSRPFV